MRSRRISAALIAIMCLTSVTVHSGCIGSFALTKAMYKFNKDISSNKFLQWVVFLLMIILPVYEIGLLVDVLVLNSLEFWFGSNPMAQGSPPQQREVALAQDARLRLVRLDAEHMRITLLRPAGVALDVVLEVESQGAALYDAQGKRLGSVGEDATGALLVRSASGQELVRLDGAARAELGEHRSVRELVGAVAQRYGVASQAYWAASARRRQAPGISVGIR